jgi:hypothetical protein
VLLRTLDVIVFDEGIRTTWTPSSFVEPFGVAKDFVSLATLGGFGNLIYNHDFSSGGSNEDKDDDEEDDGEEHPDVVEVKRTLSMTN